jgi:hypothetical protein
MARRQRGRINTAGLRSISSIAAPGPMTIITRRRIRWAAKAAMPTVSKIAGTLAKRANGFAPNRSANQLQSFCCPRPTRNQDSFKI